MALDIFVPGRLCLFGEHSDWAAGYRRVNSEIEKGCTIIAGTNQGTYARVEPHPSKLVMSSTLADGRVMGPHEVPMDRDALLEQAEAGGFFSYAAGVAYQLLLHYRIRGAVIDNYRMDLPLKKGLSSSAAICVLTARAFNRLYNLKMTVRGEMEYAYLGEITTPSCCGRMDQGCAFGGRPILMTYDRDAITVKELRTKGELHMVIVDPKKDGTMGLAFKDNGVVPGISQLTAHVAVAAAGRPSAGHGTEGARIQFAGSWCDRAQKGPCTENEPIVRVIGRDPRAKLVIKDLGGDPRCADPFFRISGRRL